MTSNNKSLQQKVMHRTNGLSDYRANWRTD